MATPLQKLTYLRDHIPGLEITVRQVENRVIADLNPSAEVTDGRFLLSTCGFGSTADEALEDLYNTLTGLKSGQRLVQNSGLPEHCKP